MRILKLKSNDEKAIFRTPVNIVNKIFIDNVYLSHRSRLELTNV